MSDTDVTQQFHRAVTAVLSLAVTGVVGFAAYVISDIKEDITKCRGMLIAIHQEIAALRAVQAKRGEQMDELKRQVVEMQRELDKKW